MPFLQIFVSLQVEDEIAEYIDLAPNIYNPVYISVLVFLLIMLFIYVSYKHIYKPLIKKHRKDKQDYEINTAKLLRIVSELDPNPIIRVDISGAVKGYNKAAGNLFANLSFGNADIQSVIPEINLKIREAIESDKHFIIKWETDNKHFEISFQGISFMGMAQLYFRDITIEKEYDEQMQKYNNLLKSSSAMIQRAQEDERRRISRELHDSVGQNLLLIKLNLKKQKKSDNGKNIPEFNHTLDILNSTIDKVRDVARNLKPVDLDEIDLKTHIKTMCINISRGTGIKYHLQISESLSALSREIQLSMYSIIQESLNNIAKHSNAEEFIINIIPEDDTIVLSIADNGRGFIPEKLLNEKYISQGLGLINMQETAERVNGQFQIDSALNFGTNIIVSFPLDN